MNIDQNGEFLVDRGVGDRAMAVGTGDVVGAEVQHVKFGEFVVSLKRDGGKGTIADVEVETEEGQGVIGGSGALEAVETVGGDRGIGEDGFDFEGQVIESFVSLKRGGGKGTVGDVEEETGVDVVEGEVAFLNFDDGMVEGEVALLNFDEGVVEREVAFLNFDDGWEYHDVGGGDGVYPGIGGGVADGVYPGIGGGVADGGGDTDEEEEEEDVVDYYETLYGDGENEEEEEEEGGITGCFQHDMDELTNLSADQRQMYRSLFNDSKFGSCDRCWKEGKQPRRMSIPLLQPHNNISHSRLKVQCIRCGNRFPNLAALWMHSEVGHGKTKRDRRRRRKKTKKR